MNEVTKTKIENEIEWRRMMFKELQDLRKDFQAYKVKSYTLIIGLIALIEGVSSYLKK